MYNHGMKMVETLSEAMNNADYGSILFASKSPSWVKGIAFDANGVYAESLRSEMIKRLTIDDTTLRG
jgi:hypothetical protein